MKLFTFLAVALGIVGVLTVSAQADTLKADLSWTNTATAAMSVQSVKVSRKVGTGAYAVIATVAPTATAYSDTGLAVGQVYCWKVNAANSVGMSPDSNEFCSASIVPSAPTGLNAVVTIVPGP